MINYYGQLSGYRSDIFVNALLPMDVNKNAFTITANQNVKWDDNLFSF